MINMIFISERTLLSFPPLFFVWGFGLSGVGCRVYPEATEVRILLQYPKNSFRL